MSELANQGSKYTDEQRREVATLYAVKGSLSAISRETNIPRTTLRDWKQSDWWDGLVAELRHEKADEHIAKYTALVSDAIEYAHANLDKASPKDALIMAATATDKARLLLNQPTNISSQGAGVQDLLNEFKQLSRTYRSLDDTTVSKQ